MFFQIEMGRTRSSSGSSTDDRRKRRKSHKRRRDHRRRSGDLAKSVQILTDSVLKIGSYLNLDLGKTPACRSRSTSRKTSRSRSRSPFTGRKEDLGSSPIKTPPRRSRSPFSVPRGENEEARKEWADQAKKTHTQAEKESTNSQEILVIDVPNESLLKLLGADPGLSNKTGAALHSGVASRWHEIAKSGLPKEERDAIKMKFKPPPNCEFGPPVINPELAKAVLPIVRSRDDELSRVQTNLQVSISALGSVVSGLLNDKEPLNRENLISNINDAGRFLVGTQYSVSLLRRRIIKDNVKDSSIKELLHETPIYPNLFEADLSQKIKQMQTLTRVGNDITKANPGSQQIETRSATKRTDSSRSSGSTRQNLNSFRPPPHQKYRSVRGGRSMRK